MNPLPLGSARWASLRAHFGNAGVDGDLSSVPTLLEQWQCVVGTYAEEYAYGDLYESYLHQRTILDVAYAIVPHLVAHLGALDPDRRDVVLEHIALVDRIRLVPCEDVEAAARELEAGNEPGSVHHLVAQNIRDRHPLLPEDLAPAYLAAIEQAKGLAGEVWGRPRPDEYGVADIRRHVRFLRASGWTDEDIRFGVEALGREHEPGTLVGHPQSVALAELRALTGAPPGWLDRTKLSSDDGWDLLGFRAIHALAWIASHIDVNVMLATR